MRPLKIFFLIGLMLCCFSTALFSQQLQVKNVRFESSGKIVKIQYDLYGQIGKSYKISLKLSDDNGVSYKIRPRTTTGDVGKNISVGKNKEIKWKMYEDFPQGLAGNKFVFAVDAELQKGRKWAYYLVGTGVAAGAAVFYLSQRKKETLPKTGSIIIDIPN